MNQIEIQNIRHICGHCTNFCDKIKYYKTLTEDQKVLNAYDTICANLDSLKQTLSNML